MSLVAFFAAWTLLALGIAGLAFAWSVRSGQWEEVEAVKYLLFRHLAAEAAEPTGDPRPLLLAALAGGAVLFAVGVLLGASVPIVLRGLP